MEKLREAIALGQDPAFVEQLRARSRENTWDARVQVILAAIESNGPMRTNGDAE